MFRRVSRSLLVFRILTIALILFSLVPSAGAQVETALDRAETWLLGQQNLNGSVGRTAELLPRDSAATVLALAGRSNAETAVTRGAVYLEGVPEENTHFRSQRALALARSGRSASFLLANLGAFRNGGGMGAFERHESNLLDTAFAVQAFALDEGRYLFELVELLDFLQENQGTDGGWGYATGTASNLYFSSEVLVAMASLDQLAVGQQVIDDVSSFLRTHQQAGGSFGDVLSTAVAWRALLLAGQSDADLPFGSPLAYLLGTQEANGSWDGDVLTTAEVVRVLRRQQPNLVISALELTPSSVVPGAPVQVTATVKNLGPQPATASHVAVRLDALDGQLLDEKAVSALAVDEELAVVLEVESSGLTESADLFAIADSQDELVETSEDDNSASARLTLRTGPDLALFAADLATAPAQPEPNTDFQLQITARNLGETEVASFDYRIDLLVNSTPQQLATGSAGPVPVGGAVVIPVTANLPEGEHTVEVTLDPADAVEEEIEENNTSSLSFFVIDPSQADLAVLASDLVLTPADPNPGDTVTVDITVRNLGSRDATAPLALFENDPSDGGTERERTNVTVAAGETTTVNTVVTLSAGAHSLTAVADPEGAVLELDEANNRRQEFFRALPDLALGFDNLEFAPTAPLEGDPVTVSITVRNAGTEVASNVDLVVYDGDPSAGGSALFQHVFSEIPAAGNRGTSFTWTAAGGLSTLVAVADADDLVLELSESNNRAEREVAVPRSSGPDLVITGIDGSALSESAETLTLSGTVDLTIDNSGDADVTTPYLVRLFEDLDGDGRRGEGEEVLASTVVGDALAAGAAAVVGLSVESTTTFFHPLVWAEVDAGNAVAERREDNNRATLFADCEIPAPASSLHPEELWYLPGVNVETAPLVLQLSDDNTDGLIDSRDTPDIVFHTTDSQGIAILAVSGLDGSEVWTFRSTPANPLVNHLAQLAAADLDGDGKVEIVGHQRNGRFLALEHDGTLAWVSDPVPGVGGRGLGGPAIGDLDGDGVPEIVLGRAVVSNTGQLIAVGTGNQGENVNFYGPFGVRKVPGVNSYPQATIADIDLDGINEVVAGDTAYRLVDGTLEVVWNATVPDNLMRDGFSAVGNLDGDPQAEIVYVSSGQIMTLSHAGGVQAGRRNLEIFSIFETPTFWGGAPTIADLDGNGTPEILVSTATNVRAYSAGLGLRWRKAIGADFGGFTGVTAFDLDGDGTMEVLLNDESTFYILNGANGQVLHSRFNHSFTAMEHPVVADVTGDGRVDIVLPSSRARNGDTSTMGLHVLSHPSWRGTRPMWNQYGYSVTNVALDGTVPSPMTPAWQADNVYRANRALAAPPTYLPNLTVSLPRIGMAGAEGVPVTVRVGNGGRQPVPAGVEIQLFAGDPATTAAVGSAVTERGLEPGAWLDLEVLWQAAGLSGVAASAVVDGMDAVAECAEDDNRVDFLFTEAVLSDPAVVAGGVAVTGPVSAGQLLPVEVTLENLGAVASPEFVVRLYNGDPTLGVVLAEATVEALGVGEERTDTVFWDTLGFSGLHLVHAVVDPERLVPEVDEENNTGLVEVLLATPTLSDLTVESFSLSATAVEAGQSVVLSAEITNRGADLADGFDVAWTVDGAEVGRLTSPGIFAAGATRLLEFPLHTAALSSLVDVGVRVDPDNALAELSEGNNTGAAELLVNGASLEIAVTTDRLSYRVDEEVMISVTAQNLTVDAKPATLQVRVVDALGTPVATVTSEAVTLAPGANVFDLSWNTGANLPGGYSVLAELLLDEGAGTGGAAARDASLFSLARDTGTRASLFTDRDVYTPLQSAIFSGSVGNTGQNDVLSDLTATLAVLDGAGDEVVRFVQPLPVLFPGADSPVNAVWNIDGAVAGTYTATLSLRDAFGVLLAFASAEFTVEDSAQTGAGLAGALTVAPATVGAGAPLLTDFTVTNGGNADLDTLSLRFDLVTLVDGTVVASVEVPQPLVRGETVEGSLALATADLAEGDYLATLVGVLPGEQVGLDRAAFTAGRGVSIANAEVLEGDGGSSTVDLAVTLSSPSSEAVTVDYATADGTATAGVDYTAASGQLTFAPGETVRTVSITVFGDLEAEADEVFLVTLSNPVGAFLGTSQGLVTLLDEEGCASPNLLVNGDAELGVPADPVVGWQETVSGWRQRFGDPPPLTGTASFAFGGDDEVAELFQDVDVSAFAATIDGGLQEFQLDGFVRTAAPSTAQVVVEYRDGAGTVLESFDSGDLSTVDVWQSVADRRVAPVGTRALRLRLVARRQGGGATTAFFDRLVLRSLGTTTLSFHDAEVFEGNGGTVSAAPRLELSCPLPSALAVDVATVDGSAISASDYGAVSETRTVPAGTVRFDVEVDVLGDPLDEPDEAFEVTVAVADPSIVLLRHRATVAILDDDGAVQLSIDSVGVPEGDPNGTPVEAVFTVSLSAASGKEVRVDFTTGNGSATAGVDYTATSGTLVVPRGSVSETISVPLTGDLLSEGDEGFVVRLSGAVNADLAVDTGFGTIFENDVVEIAVADAAALEGDGSDSTLVFPVTLSLPSVDPVTVAFATADGDALAGADYIATSGSLEFAPGITAGTVSVDLVTDLDREPLETFLLLLSTPSGALLADPEGIGSIVDDDGILISVGDVSLKEGNDGTVEAVVPVTLSKAATAEVQVDFTTRDGSAVAGADYTATTDTLVFPVGSTLAEARVPLVGDAIDEPVESFFIDLSNPVEGLLNDGEAEVTIIDNDGWFLNSSASDTLVPGCIAVTPDLTNRRGSAWRTTQLDLTSSFDKTFRVYMGTRGDSNGGEGGYFVLQRAGTTALGGSGGSQGYNGMGSSVGFEVDTVTNISGNRNDHVSIGLNGSEHGAANPVDAIPGVSQIADGQEHLLRVVWNATTNNMDVHFDDLERLYHNRDIVSQAFGGNPLVYWGFTGATSSRRNLQYFCDTALCYDPATDGTLISVGDVRATEGSSGSTVVHFPVTLSCPVDHVVEVDFLTAGGTATAGVDYGLVSERLVFQPGETSKSVAVEIFGDVDGEDDEVFFGTLENPVGGEVRYQGVGTIFTDDFIVSAVVGTSEPEGNRTFNRAIVLELNRPAPSNVRVNYSTANGTAVAGSDYTATNNSVTFSTGQTRRTINVQVRGDGTLEDDEHFFLNLSGSNVTTTQERIDLLDDDDCPSANLLVNPSNEEVPVNGQLPGWTELSGDWNRASRRGALAGSFYFWSGFVPSGELVQDVDVESYSSLIDVGRQDFVFEGFTRTDNENLDDPGRILVEYRDAGGAVLEVFDTGDVVSTSNWRRLSDLRTAPVGTRTIRVRLLTTRRWGSNNDASFDDLSLRALRFPSATVDDVSILEGELGTTPAVFTVALSCPAVQPVSIDYLTTDGTASAGSDYEATLGTVVFAPGEQVKTVQVPVVGDTILESAETFFLNLVNAVNAGLSGPQGTATIEVDEAFLSLADTTVTEGNPSGTAAQALFTVTLSIVSPLEVRVDYATADGGGGLPAAAAGSDYEAVAGTLVFAPGETVQTLAVPIISELVAEDDEAFTVTLANPVRAGLSVDAATATIFDDDLSASIADAVAVEGDHGTVEALFEVTLSTSSALPVSVDWATEDVTATAGADYTASSGTLTIPAGETLGRITVPVLGDEIVEPSETFAVRLTNGVNVGILIAEAFASITDDDDAPSDNLLENPGAEDILIFDELPDWTETVGTTWGPGGTDPAPLAGDACFGPGSASPAELSQDVDVTAYASFIDRGVQRFLFEGFVRSAAEDPADRGRFVVDYLDTANQVLDSFDSGAIANTSGWEQIVDLRLAPVGTRVVRVRLLAERFTGGTTDVCFDQLALRSLTTPVVQLSDVFVAEGDDTNVEAVIPITLNTPAEEAVTFDYSTANGSALAPGDYLAASGSVVIPAGQTAAEIRVPVVGDRLLELEESFRIELSNVSSTVAVFDDPDLRVFITDDDNVGGSTREIRTFWLGDMRIFAWADRTEITLIDIRNGLPLNINDSRISAKNFTTNPFVLERAGDSFEGVGNNVQVRVVARDANGNEQLKPITVWTGSLASSSRHPANPPSENDPWMSYMPTFSLLSRADGREFGKSFLGFTSREMYIFARRGAEPTVLVVEDLATNTDADSDDNHLLSAADAVYADDDIEIYQLTGFEDDTVRVTSNVDASVLVGKGALANTDWTTTPPSYAAGDDGIELGTEFYTLVHRSVTVFPVEDDTTVTITDLSDGDDTITFTLEHGDLDGPYDIFTPVLGTRNGGNITPRQGPVDVNLISTGDRFDNDFVKIESDKPILVYVGPAGSDVEEFADVAFSVPTGPESRIIYCYAQNGAANDLQIFGFDDDTEVTITSLTTTSNFLGGHHDFQIGPGVGGGSRWQRGTVDGDVWWSSGVWGGELLRIESNKPILVVNGDYDSPHFGAFMPFVVDTNDLPPRADAGLDQTVFTAETVLFDGTGSFDQDEIPGPLPPRYEWDLDLAADTDGDGDPTNDVDSTEAMPSRVYLVPGVYEVQLTYFDDEGEADTDFATVTVIAHPLRVTKLDDRDLLLPGEAVNYTVTLINTGTDLSGVVVRDVLPEHTSLQGAVTTSVGTVVSNDPIEVQIDALAAGGTVTITFAAQLDPAVPATVTEVANQATADSNELPQAPSDDPATAEPFDPTRTPVFVPPVLEALKTDALTLDQDGDGVAAPGDEVSYTITVHNLRGGLASAVLLTDSIPANTTVVPGSATTDTGSVTAEDPLTVALGDLAAGQGAVVTFTVVIDNPLPGGVDEIANQGVVSSNELPDLLTDDPDTADPADPTRTPVIGEPELAASKVDALVEDGDGDGQPSPGDLLRYTVVVSNSGAGSATGVTFGDVIPQHTNLVPGSVTTSAGTVLSEDPVEVELGTLDVAAAVTITFDVEIANPIPGDVSEVVNQGTVASDQRPPVLTDDPDVGGDADPTVTPITAAPVLEALKIDGLVVDADGDGLAAPGDEVLYLISVSNSGNTGATQVVLRDAIPDHTALVPDTVTTSQGVVLSEEPEVEIDLGEVLPGSPVEVSFQVRLEDPFSAAVEEISNQARVESAELAEVLSDDPDTVLPADPTVTPVFRGLTTVCKPLPFGEDGPLDEEWQTTFLGDADQGGATVVGESVEITGDGTSLFRGPDNGVFVHRTAAGDFRFEVDLEGFPVDAGGEPRKSGAMVRGGLDALSPRVMVNYMPQFPGTNSSALQYEYRDENGVTRNFGLDVLDVPLPVRLAFEKRGDVYTALYSLDGGETWRLPGGAQNGTIEVRLGETVEVGMAVASYDADVTLTARFANADLCGPNPTPPEDPPPPVPCDPAKALDVVYLLDLSGSMKFQHDGGFSRLDAAQGALAVLSERLAQRGDGSRAALVTFAGFRTPEENLAGGAVVQSPFTSDFSALDALVQSFSTAELTTDTPTPTALGLRATLDILLAEADSAHQTAVVLLTDGITNIDGSGRGPDEYELQEIQALSLKNSAGQFLTWQEVAWQGGFNLGIGTFDGETLSNAMFEVEQLKLSLPELLIYGVAFPGDGLGLGTFNDDLVEYAAWFSGGRSFQTADMNSLVTAVNLLIRDLECGGVGSSALGGRVWEDSDGNGVQDAMEPGLGGVTVDLLDEAGFGILTTVTAADGTYLLSELPAGTYTVRLVSDSLPQGITLPTFDFDGLDSPGEAQATVGEGEQQLAVDFGYRRGNTDPPGLACTLDTFDDGVLEGWTFAFLGDADQGEALEMDATLWLTGDGSSLFRGPDNGALLYQDLSGDFRVEVDLTGFPVDAGGVVRKAGLMVRDGLDPLAPRVMVNYVPHFPDPATTALQWEFRDETGRATNFGTNTYGLPLPVRLAIERQGDLLRASYSVDGGVTWRQPGGALQGVVPVVMGETVLAGLDVASYDGEITLTTAFDNFLACTPTPDVP